MLQSFRVANHRSIRDETQLLLTPAYDTDRPAGTNWPAVPVAGIFGANAAGKSNVLKALSYMRSMVVNSLREAEPMGGVGRRPFLLDTAAAHEPSLYVVDLCLVDGRYTYGFVVDDERVLEEWLYRYQASERYPNGRKQVLFDRNRDSFNFCDSLDKVMRVVSDITDPNVLFLSIAARSRQPDVMPVYSWFAERLVCLPARGISRDTVTARTIQMLDHGAGGRARLLDLVRAADLGITDIELERVSIDEELLGRVHDRQSILRFVGRAVDRDQLSFEGFERLDVREKARGRRSPSTNFPRLTSDRPSFAHHGEAGDGNLTLDDQSQGTLTLLNLAGDFLTLLDAGGMLVIDEIDASLHPLLSARLIGLFQNKESNPHGAQLVFASHDATLLGKLHGDEVLKRDQIWFVEKDERGATSLVPLSDFKPRQDENRERRYLNGSYGAVPFVPAELFERALNMRGDWSGGAPTGD